MRRWQIILLTLFGIFSLGYYTVPEHYFEIAKNIEIFADILRIIDKNYVDEVDPDKFVKVGIDAMLKSLDPYMSYITSSEIEGFRFMSTGKYGGIGSKIFRRGNYIVIAEVYEGGPAARAGLLPGDTILQIDDKIIADKVTDLEKVSNMLRGQEGTQVKVRVARYGAKEPLWFTLTREEIKIPEVPYYTLIDNKYAYVRLSNFTLGAADEVRRALEQLKTRNPQLQGIILDLRNNPGGLLMEAVGVANLFIEQGEKVVETRGRAPNANQVYHATKTPFDTQTPLVILVNRNSASASEIVAGVIQDLDRGVIIGEQSYGKGLVQTTHSISYNGTLKITTARYYTPSGRCIQAVQYQHGDAKRRSIKIADSLRKTFRTRHGRAVLDAGGISPDSTIQNPKDPEILKQLSEKYLLFDFAVRYIHTHPKPQNWNEITLNDNDFQAFIQFVKKQNFQYQPPEQVFLTKLDTLLKDYESTTEIKKAIEQLKSAIQTQNEKVFYRHKKAILRRLKQYIALMYFYQKGMIATQLEKDPYIAVAKYFLSHPQAYRKILNLE